MCCDSGCRKESDMTEQLNGTELFLSGYLRDFLLVSGGVDKLNCLHYLV